MSIELAILIMIAMLVCISTAMCAAIYLMNADVQHSIEDIKHLTIAAMAKAGGGEGVDELKKFLNPNPTLPGDVKIHLPDSLLHLNDD